ncbi:hypothetical protein [Bacillus sp. EB01]|uniref:hypothetical protein n=1 Tax=Bacillus sp. EB01 TaxID=1347086 RepID=UPI0005C61DD0|nr:hypothetical protein [Bacillus sp. EB01]
MKGLSASIFGLGVCILLAAWFLSNAIEDKTVDIPNELIVNQPGGAGSLQLVVNQGWLYLYDTANGQIWKKPDDEESLWEEVKHYTNQ